MQITHEEAQRLIQFNADNALGSNEKNLLVAHLQECISCRVYAQDIKEVESILLPLMKRQWNLQPVPLSGNTLTTKRNSAIQARMALVTRTAMIGVVLLGFIFSVWQFTLSNRQLPSSLVGVLPVPTPSTQSTSTEINLQNCEELFYQVKESDTLESIAARFSISKEQIRTINHLKTISIHPSMKLMIPICNFTPTGTVNPMTLTWTYTPIIDDPTISTPGG
ncbi:MAG TPA: LysM peptidoglycan-binding domain-containing protein [Anaerolineales bacterium]|nr:LysM peptidoglycan-binding domain-containing protein [Anaerolineales bacterium]